MAYRIEWDMRAYRELKQIETKPAVEILNAINKLYENPREAGKALEGKLKGKYRLQVGDYRVIYWIDKSTVWIVSVGHRKEIYR
ncbi:type II toxin-antitoxin system RelE family toxin [Candidatus Magnetominusculus xianensis]|uniref:RelE/StbE family addiction module toxin n=1 Tax=Candidatus Magnetominusculus xianensis TaxID=1748249 RepID=A0ABR5SF54_9BACT|nr:type II toxin-antitoxin system RelE/ParE family toxin [Candidatus Magnetominusculus xianensis]KWT83439.1 RelE/StbE family addiction module toxin [Candidatus Magnetominusculus xianensis]MBF0405082.1 type II toxin-antitoxin system RelE/ParE family toxin [Nitrospirota bacterium]